MGHGARGLKRLMYLLRLNNIHQQASVLPLDVIFVSIDLKVPTKQKDAIIYDPKFIPHVEELGIATLNTRHIFTSQTSSSQERFIRTRQYSAAHSSKDFEGCDVTDFRECAFAETERIQQNQIVPTVDRFIRVRDTESDGTASKALRPIVIVGHDIKHDIRVLQRLGAGMKVSFPIVAVLDTHLMRSHLLGTGHAALEAALTGLGCPHQGHELDNGGDGATYTLHAMLLLALQLSEQREETAHETRNRRLVQVFTDREVNEARRWQPIRGSLGARAGEGDGRPHRNWARKRAAFFEAQRRADILTYRTASGLAASGVANAFHARCNM